METAVSGAPAHTRSLNVSLARGGPLEILARGHVIDLRKRGLVPMAGDLQTAGIIHDMRVEAAIEPAGAEGPRLARLRAEQPGVAFEPSPGTGGECCRDPVRRIEALAGTPLDAAAARRLSDAIGGPRGCSHVLTIAQLLLSTARTALRLDAERHGERPERLAGQRIFQRSLCVDGVHTSAGSLELAAQLSDVHFAPAPAVAAPMDRLAGWREVRVQAEVDLDSMTWRRLSAAERDTGPGGAPRPFRDRSDAVAGLAGRSALRGTAPWLFERLGEAPDDRPLLDVLLSLAPTLIQCIPAIADRWRSAGDGERPSMMAGGGMVDSCYMWRRDGALGRRVAEEIAAMRGEPAASEERTR
jgi:hypothetical protein